jgi:1-acyl-sn-glycerol-3-phosphate acyltransferase
VLLLKHIMWLGSLKAKWQILTAPLADFNFFTRWVIRFILFTFGGLIRIEHCERLTDSPWPLIIALNHNNYSETFIVPCALSFLRGGQNISFLVHWMFRLIPILNWVLKQNKSIWVYNRRLRWGWLNRFKPFKRKDIFQESLQRLKQDTSLGIFPEGGRNNDPFTLNRGRMGIGRIVLEAEVAVLPVGIDYLARTKRKKIPALGKMVLRIGKPLYFAAEREKYRRLHSGTPKTKAGKNKQQAVEHQRQNKLFVLYSEISHRIMREISLLCGKDYPYSEILR